VQSKKKLMILGKEVQTVWVDNSLKKKLIEVKIRGKSPIIDRLAEGINEMSTPKWKAREVRKLARYKGHNYYYEHFHYFLTEDGRKFVWARHDEWNKDTKFFIVHHTGDHKSVEFKYWIYPIPFNVAINTEYREPRLKWFGNSRYLVVETKRV